MISIQSKLEDELVSLIPLQESDFEKLYEVASDPLIWEQHPSWDRYKKEVFQDFFKGAMDSKGGYLILEKETGEIIGSSRYYEYDAAEKSIAIGYTFIARKFWGGKYNSAIKKLMIDHAFTFADQVIFHVGMNNIRSQKAVLKLGAVKTGVKDNSYIYNLQQQPH